MDNDINNTKGLKTNKLKGLKTYLVYALGTSGLVLGVGLGLAIKNDPTPFKTPYHYHKECRLPNDMDVKGSRRYLNQAFNLLGFSYVDVNKALEDTTLASSMEETTIVGFTGEEWWSVHNPAAQPTVINLKKADSYIFTQGKKVFVVTYDDLCK